MSVTIEIFLIWTNVTRTDVAWIIVKLIFGNKRRIRILLGVGASTQHIAGKKGRAAPEGQLVLDDAVLRFWIS